MNKALNPKTPNPTTPRPITAPPAKATSNALPRDALAALVVLTFALVATFIPINPASAEQIAPTIKDTATIPFDPSSLLPLKNNKIATATTKIAKILYSAFKNDIAPSAIFLAIRFILSVPWSCLLTQALLTNTNTSANTPNAGKNCINDSI